MTAAHKLLPSEAPPERALPVLLIPAYEPPRLLTELLWSALATGRFSAAIVIDDGSSPACASIFEACARVATTVVLRQPRRSGKGAALKAGLAEVRARFPDAVGVVTADADGQHLPQDIRSVAAALAEGSGERGEQDDLILGARRFDGDVPLRSRLGNALTRRVMRFVTGRRLTDTQTGLRGIPREMIPELLGLASNGYEFELDMLLCCRGGRGLREVPIQTVYAAGNRTSHFDPIVDSMRIYWVLLRFFFASLAWRPASLLPGSSRWASTSGSTARRSFTVGRRSAGRSPDTSRSACSRASWATVSFAACMGSGWACSRPRSWPSRSSSSSTSPCNGSSSSSDQDAAAPVTDRESSQEGSALRV
jgi:hypothetical protein